jgi:serine/threonine-protein kinase
MSAVAIVAAGRDAQFAEQVRAGLKSAGREAFLQEQLPSDSAAQVVLIWSAALEAVHAIDAQALIGLWSENRLVVARRDATPLPLGLRDLPSLGPQAGARDVVRAATGAAKQAPRSRIAPIVGAIFVVVAVTGVGWYWYNKGSLEKQAALTAALESATKASEELKAVQSRQLEALKALEQAREAEAKARAASDATALKKTQEASQRAEEEAKKQAALVKAQEEKAAKAREDMKKAQDAAKQAKAEPAKQETVAAVAPKAETAAPKAEAAAPKAEAAAPKAETPKVEAPKKSPTSRSERERIADEEAARKALEKAGKSPSSQQQTQVASAAPTPGVAPGGASTEHAATSKTEFDVLYQQAVAMEGGGDAKGAIRIYRRAARAGSGKAAKRLGEIFDRGVAGVPRDYAESLQWYETARQLGETVETAGKR